MSYKLKILWQQYDTLRHILESNNGEERACFLLCATATTSQGKLLLAREVVQLGSDDLLIQSQNQLSVKPEAMLRTARQAKQRGLSVCFVHTHPIQEGAVQFSFADDIGNTKSFRFFNRMVPDGINSALVFDRSITAVTGRIYISAEHWETIEKIEVAGEPYILNTVDGSSDQCKDDVAPDCRHLPLIGEKGIRLLSNLSFAVISAGGIGSISSILLAHSGGGQIMVVDHGLIHKTNLPRIINATPDDVRDMVAKVDIAANYIDQTCPECTVHPKISKVQNPELFSELIGVDVIICGTDDHTSRAFLNQLCQQYYIPLLDLGVEFVASSENGEIVNEVGKINLVLPGTACLFCSNHIDSDRVRFENLPDDQKEQYIKDGYIRGVNDNQPSMMMFNMEVASRGIQLLVSHLLGIKKVPTDRYERFSFFSLNGRRHHKEVKKHQNECCIFCGKSSVYLGMGDSKEMLITSECEMEVAHA